MALHNNGGNFTNVGVVQLDDEGNMLTCPTCGSTHIIKRGKDKHIVGTPQRYEGRSTSREMLPSAEIPVPQERRIQRRW